MTRAPEERVNEWHDDLRGVEEGQRKVTACRIAGLLVRHGFSNQEIIGFLYVWNTFNHPPWPPQEVNMQVHDILRSVQQWRQKEYQQNHIQRPIHTESNTENAESHEKSSIAASALYSFPVSVDGVPNWHLSGHIFRDMPASVFKVYHYMTRWYQARGQNAHLSQPKLAKATGLSKRTVIRALQYLRQVHLVERTFKGFKTRRGALANRYALIPPVLAEKKSLTV